MSNPIDFQSEPDFSDVPEYHGAKTGAQVDPLRIARIKAQSVRRRKDQATANTGTWNPGVAAVLSFFVPGLGQIYKGRIWDGLGWLIMILWFYIFSPFILHPACIFIGFALHIICIFVGYFGSGRKFSH